MQYRLGRRRLGHASRLRRAQQRDGHQRSPTFPTRAPVRPCRTWSAAASTILCDIIATAKPQIDGGKVKGIAIMTKERSPVLPNLATTGEQGLDVQAYTWSALFLRKARRPTS